MSELPTSNNKEQTIAEQEMIFAKETYLRITSYSPRNELDGIERGWIEKKIAECLSRYREYLISNKKL